MWILAHEISHGIDRTGIYFDQYGSLDMKMLSTNSRQEYSQRVSCFEENGKMTANENMADINGLRLVFQMFKDNTEPNIDEIKDFFISYAQLHCSGGNNDSNNRETLHLSPSFRVNKVLYQLTDFKKAFSCNNFKSDINNKCDIFH